MAKSSNQKLKILYLLDIFKTHTDEDTYITMEEIISLLSKKGVSAERKSIYEDIALLNDYGAEIEFVRKHGYHLLCREFELPELKLLVDAVQASKFITEKKSNQLIKKLESLTSKGNASELQHSVVMRERIKSMNESVFINVDIIQSAIKENKQITFRYFDWDIHKNRVFRHQGELYVVSPWALIWDDENYYLVAFDQKSEIFKHYRVDKMMTISVSSSDRQGFDNWTRFDVGAYSKKMFGMYGGEIKKVKLFCHESLLGVFIDRFGADLMLTPADDGFEVMVEACVSPVFLSWLMQFGNKVKVLYPEDVKTALCTLAKEIIDEYNE